MYSFRVFVLTIVSLWHYRASAYYPCAKIRRHGTPSLISPPIFQIKLPKMRNLRRGRILFTKFYYMTCQILLQTILWTLVFACAKDSEKGHKRNIAVQLVLYLYIFSLFLLIFGIVNEV